jgi:NIPSNAP protein
MIAMIVEVRNYRVVPGRRDEFIEFFQQRAIPAQREHGIAVLGPLLDVENPHRFHWLRAFPSLADRERMRTAFYTSRKWTEELEGIAMPMLDSWDFAIGETSPGCAFDDLRG